MSRSFSWVTTVLAVVTIVLAADSIAHAQGRQRGQRGGGGFGQGGGGFGGGGFGGGRRGGGMDAGSLLRSEQVQAELKLSEEQVAQIETLMEESRNQSRELFTGLRDLSDDERAAKMEELRTKRDELQAEMRTHLATTLDAAQLKRLDEITLQVRGLEALTDAEFVSKLSITDEQKQGIDDLVAAQREMQRELFGSMRELRDLEADERTAKLAEIRKQGEELTSETKAAALELLTEEQRTSYAALQGAPFELDRAALFGGGRGGRGGGGPGGDRAGRGRPGGGQNGGNGRGAARPQRPEAI